MRIFIITFRSVTFAQRGERLLNRNNHRCVLQRTPKWMEQQGCGYSLRIKTEDIIPVVELLRENGVPLRKIYAQRPDGNLEELTGELVRGFAYPYGTYNETVEEVLSACGIEYARTVVDTNGFDLPADFLEWHPTCHHESQSLMEIAKDFCENDGYSARLFYLWGHSYEFDVDDNWEYMESILKKLAFHDDIFYGTNSQVLLQSR